MRRRLQIFAAAVAALALLGVITIGVLVGLNAECNGPTTDCPRSATYRYALVALPPASLALLVSGTVWSIRRRSLRPLVLAEAAVLGLGPLVGVFLGSFGAVTVLVIAVAVAVGWSALQRDSKSAA
jgi:hypothetical protein